MNKRYKIILILCIVLLAFCIVSCLSIWNRFRERELVTIELPSGDRIVICFYPYRDLLNLLFDKSGGLRYHIYSEMLSHHGSLTIDSKYDTMYELNLTYEIQGERQVKIKDGRGHPGWIFSGARSGHYSIVNLYKYVDLNKNKVSETSKDTETK